MKCAIVALIFALAVNGSTLPRRHAHGHGHHHIVKRERSTVTSTLTEVVVVESTKTVWVPKEEKTSKVTSTKSETSTTEEPTTTSTTKTEEPTKEPETTTTEEPKEEPTPEPEPTTPSTTKTSTPTPEPTPEPKPPVIKAPEPEPEPSPDAGSGGPSEGTYKGEVTYYNPGVGLGSCGVHSADSSFTVAVSATLLAKYDVDANPNHNKLCGKMIRVFRAGKSVDVKIMDKCPGAECTEYSLDLSPAAFDVIGNQADGRYHDMSWSFIDQV